MSKLTIAQMAGQAVNTVRRFFSLLWRLEARIRGVQIAGPITLLGRPLISRARNSRVVLGEGVILNSALRSNPLACFQPCTLRTLAPGAELTLGQGVGLSGTVLCAGRKIEIGEGTIIGAGAMIIDNDFHAPDGQWGWRPEYQANARPVRIGRGVFIGARAIILKGVTIGDRAVIGAGAVVTRDVPAGHIAAGNPARVFPPKGSSNPAG